MMNEFGQPIGEPLPGWQPRPAPTGVVLEGRHCRLEPLDRRHVPALHEALNLADPDGRGWTYMPWGPYRDIDEFAASLEWIGAESGFLFLAIIDAATGLAQGMAGWGRIDPAIGSIEVGGIIYGAQLQRTPAATEAMYLMASHVFDDLGYRRYEWKCDSLNAPSRAAARRLGFLYEGTWRNATIYKERNRDTAWFAMTDVDWAAQKQVLARWLDPENFDADGGQRASLSALTAAERS